MSYLHYFWNAFHFKVFVFFFFDKQNPRQKNNEETKNRTQYHSLRLTYKCIAITTCRIELLWLQLTWTCCCCSYTQNRRCKWYRSCFSTNIRYTCSSPFNQQTWTGFKRCYLHLVWVEVLPLVHVAALFPTQPNRWITISYWRVYTTLVIKHRCIDRYQYTLSHIHK